MLDGTPNGATPQIGIGLRTPYQSELLARRPALDFLEVHAENYMDFGSSFDELLTIRRDYPLSLHGVGLSLGSADGIDCAHLTRFRDLIARTEPIFVSEHLSWSIVDGIYLNDLLPLPYTEDSLEIVAQNIARAQEALTHQILIENPSRYLRFKNSPIPEAEFLAELVRRTGCGLLCDVNNVYVSAVNTGEQIDNYLDILPADAVQEIHLAGHAERTVGSRTLLIDDHGSQICADVWALYDLARSRFPSAAALIERDSNLPPLDELLSEATRARRIHAVLA